jgi:phosphoserine phosphatase RsbU/P
MGYHWIDSDHFSLYLLDVCGHGVGPSLMSVAVLHMLRSASLRDVDLRKPGEVLSTCAAVTRLRC